MSELAQPVQLQRDHRFRPGRADHPGPDRPQPGPGPRGGRSLGRRGRGHQARDGHREDARRGRAQGFREGARAWPRPKTESTRSAPRASSSDPRDQDGSTPLPEVPDRDADARGSDVVWTSGRLVLSDAPGGSTTRGEATDQAANEPAVRDLLSGEAAAAVPAWFPDWARELRRAVITPGRPACSSSTATSTTWSASPTSEPARLRQPPEFLATQLFGNWDVVFRHDLSHGLRVFAGTDARATPQDGRLARPSGSASPRPGRATPTPSSRCSISSSSAT